MFINANSLLSLGKEKLIDFLVEKGFDINAKVSGNTPLLLASKNGNEHQY